MGKLLDTKNIENSIESVKEGVGFVYENYWKFNKILRGGLGFWVRRDIINSIRSLREGEAFVYEKY